VTEIRTARLILRRARVEDLDAIHAVLSNALAMRFWSRPPHASLDQTRLWLASTIDAPADAGDDYVVELDGQVIGKAGCWRLPEIGFILHPDHWRRGLAREALEALTADVDPRNAASLALLKGLGFVETGRAKGTWDLGGELCDSIYLALARK